MKFDHSKDIAAPLEFVYAQLTDFEQFQRLAARRNTRVTRLDSLAGIGPGMRWRLNFRLRGREREIELRLHDLVPHRRILYAIDGQATSGSAQIELAAVSPDVTRMTNSISVNGRKLGMWLVLQSMRLAHGRVASRIDDAAERLAEKIGRRWTETRPRR